MAQIFESELEKQNLADVLGTIHKHKVPGKVTLTQGHAQRHIYIHAGQIIFALSNLKKDRLGEFLISHNVIGRDQLAQANDLHHSKHHAGVRLGKVFLEMGLFDAETLGYYIKCQIKNMIMDSFGWHEGRIRFWPGPQKTDELIQLKFDTPLAVMEGLVGQKSLHHAQLQFGEKGQFVLKKNGIKLEYLMPGRTFPQEYAAVFSLLDGNRDVAAVAKSLPHFPKAFVLNLLLAFKCLGLIAQA